MLEVESKKELIIHISNDTKIFKPIPKKLCRSYNPKSYIKKNSYKNKTLTQELNFDFDFDEENIPIKKDKKEIKHLNKFPELQIEKISYKEMEEDFVKLRELKETKKAEKELIELLRNSTKDDSQDENSGEKIEVKRPKKVNFENYKYN